MKPVTGRVTLETLRRACPFPVAWVGVEEPQREIEIESYMHRPGLLLVGFRTGAGAEHHILVFGREEFDYLDQLPATEQNRRLDWFFDQNPPLLVLAEDLEPPAYFLESARTHRVPVWRTSRGAREILAAGFRWLERLIAPRVRMNGNLMVVFGAGILITGSSGIGKSECSLELLARGHKLVADDAIEILYFQDGTVLGRAPEMGRGFMEVRGLGVVDVRRLFGVLAVQEEAPVDLVIQLVPSTQTDEVQRLHADLEAFTFPRLPVQRPMVRLPVVSGRSVGILVEVAVRWYLLKERGDHDVQRFLAAVDAHAAGEEPHATE